MNPSCDKKPTTLFNFTHQQKNNAVKSDFDGNDLALTCLVDEDDVDILVSRIVGHSSAPSRRVSRLVKFSEEEAI